MLEAFKRNLDVIWFTIKTRGVFVSIFVSVAGFAFWSYTNNEKLAEKFQSIWNDKVDTWISIATLVVAFAVWWVEVKRDWKANLPKRLTVDFLYGETENTVVMRCEKAFLSDMADTRALGQQIGSQLVSLVNNNSKPMLLHFRAPSVRQKQERIELDDKIGFFAHHHIEFILIKLPDLIDETECRIWRAPFNKEDITICDPVLK